VHAIDTNAPRLLAGSGSAGEKDGLMTSRTKDSAGASRAEQIDILKQRLSEASGGHMVSWESESLPDEEREKFWHRVAAFEEGPFTTDFERLTSAGVELPEPESLDDAAVTAKLSEVIDRLARMSIFVSHTDHLNDRELYSHLWNSSLREEVPESSGNDGGVTCVDLLIDGSEASTRLYLRYYASESERQQWLEDEPDFDMPPHEDPPYDRDRHLPQPFEGLAGL
jgi:hypothetical protein